MKNITLKEWQKFALAVLVFLFFYFFPMSLLAFRNPFFEAVALLQEYARQHVLLCLVPAFFIAGAISVFVGQNAVLKYFGPKAKKVLAYGVASVSGTILAVCSCTVLPLFSGIYRRGAGLGPATTFLYSGPAINIMAIILTAKVLGWEMGIARAAGAVIFSILIGLLMHFIFLKEERRRHEENPPAEIEGAKEARTIKQNAVYLFTMVGILVFANWTRLQGGDGRIFSAIFHLKWYITGALLLFLLYMLKTWFKREELRGWVSATWIFAKQILPLLFAGVFVAGLLLGRPGHEGFIPSGFVAALVGGNSFFANFFASVVGAFMYFATLTEVPILQGLIGSGMGKGPALALLLAGPALSLPNMLVIKSILGLKKTAVYILLVIMMATISGLLFGLLR
ncbi:MAG: permease [Candidatus Omnitrophica bacterium]|nr:permease [Candidatus Omnitrophota bacterium]